MSTFLDRSAASGADSVDADFDAPRCRNCGGALATPFCAHCGQKRARRLSLRDVGDEAWQRLRVFERSALKTAAALVLTPGVVAREYVEGMRARHVHPLKLLMVLVALLLVVLARNAYFTHFGAGIHADQELKRMAALVQGYGNWSFSLGLFAIWAASMATWWRRSYNPTEHLVLAVYSQCVILLLVIVNLLPTLIWRDAGFINQYKALSGIWLYALKALVVGAGYVQFFQLQLRRDWLTLLIALLGYVGLSGLLQYLYAAAVLHVVQWQMAG